MKKQSTINSTLTLWQLTSTEARQQLAELLFLADESWEMIDQYLATGTIFALQEQGEFIGSIVVQAHNTQQLEIMNLAVTPARQHRGYGKLLISVIEKWAQQQQFNELRVGTGDASITNIAFYLHCGFRFVALRPHFFDQYPQPIIEGGLQLVDMVVLGKPLTQAN